MKKYLSRKYDLFFWIGIIGICLFPITLSGQPQFEDVSEEAGINHIFKVFEGTFGGGAAIIDFDKDGWEDVFLAGGAAPSQLLKNKGDGTFVDIADGAGISALDGLVTQGAAVADVNKDGWPDLFITTIAVITGQTFTEAPNVLLINNQDGTFSDQSKAYNLLEETFSSSASFGDVNRDGFPDLYISNYFEDFDGQLDQFGGPISGGSAQPAGDLLYINDQGKRFVESSLAYGIERKGLTFQGLWSDIDNDRDLDLLVANDFGNRGTPNLLYRNDFPENTFTEIGADKKFDYGMNGMGIGATDINGDGWMDYLVTNIQVSPFFINRGPDFTFLDQSLPRGSGFFTVPTDSGVRITPISWGVNFFDVDHDMDTDLFISNGCLNPVLAPSPNLMLENTNGKFLDYGFISNTNDHSIGRGSVVFDYDNDGDLDLLVVNQTPHREENVGVDFLGTRLFRNEQESQQNWLKIQLNGIRSESSGIGSRVEAYIGRKPMIREVYGGSSHQSQNSTLVHFGLGPHNMVDSIVIKWSSGQTQLLQQVSANQSIRVEEEFEPVSDGIRVYPSPFEKRIYVDVSEQLSDQPARISLLNLMGQTIFRKDISSLSVVGNTISIDQPFSKGIYILVVEGDTFTYSEKVMKTE